MAAEVASHSTPSKTSQSTNGATSWTPRVNPGRALSFSSGGRRRRAESAAMAKASATSTS
jgi:hypothetical protein